MASKDSSSPLVVETSKAVLVKPSKATPQVSLSLSTIDNDIFFERIDQTICVFSPKPYGKHDLASLLKHGLSQALVFYYPLAGKLHRKSDDNRLELNCKAGDGVPYIRATANCTLSSLNYLENVGEEANQLVPCYGIVKGCEGYDALALQVTKFTCGGITVGIAFSHSVCDGVGMAQFIRTMIELASGKTVPSVIPVWERERLTFNNINDGIRDDYQYPKFDKSCIATSPYILTEDMVRETLTITSEDLAKLKNKVAEEEQIKGNKNISITTLEIIAALMWRAKCRALKLNPEGTTVFSMSVGIRSIIEPPLPEGYYGNAVVAPNVALTAKDLSESTLSRLVRLIKDMKKAALDKRYLLGQLSQAETRLKEMEPIQFPNGGLMTLTDFRNIGLQTDSLGGLVNIIPLIHMPFLCILLPPSNVVPGKSGGVRLLVTLPREAMAKFKEEMNAF